MRALYKYPQAPFPYAALVEENRRRGRDQPEYELVDTGVFAEGRYFDVEVEYAKASPTDVVVALTAANRGPEAATLDLLPTLWFRDSWSWGAGAPRPELRGLGGATVEARHEELGTYWLDCEGAPELLFTENETNGQRLWGVSNRSPYVKDGINDAVVAGRTETVNPARVGTRCAARYRLRLGAGETARVRLRLSDERRSDPCAATG